VEPTESPLTSPLESTVATLLSEDVQGFVAEGVPEPVSCEVAPLQKVKEPVMDGSGFTIIVKVVAVAHCPAVGVNV